MPNLTKSTQSIKEKNIKMNWHLIDASDKILGRMSSQIASILQGKHKVTYVSYLDSGDCVVVINAKKIVVTGRKANNKVYTRYSGYPGGLKTISFSTLLEKNPSEIIRHAVTKMLPKNKLRDQRLARLYIFPDEKHSYQDKFEIAAENKEVKSKK